MNKISPQVNKRSAASRGIAEHGWLHSRHTFSFGEYFDANQMGFRSLRVINDDIVEAGGGFGSHPHRNAEIFSYIIEGELQHKDSLGNGSVIKAGDLQYISAGDGVVHSEFNPSPHNRVHFYQIWIKPNSIGGKPYYAEKQLGSRAKQNSLTLLFAPMEHGEAIVIRADAEVYFGKLDAGKNLHFDIPPGRHVWIQMIKGKMEVAGESLDTGDGLALSNLEKIEMQASSDAEFLLFNLA